MARTSVMKLQGEVLTALCNKCKCCSPDTHCFTCHSTTPMEKLCGCATCKVKLDDYVERVNRTEFNRQARKAALVNG